MGIPINRPTTELEPLTLEAVVAGITEMEVVIKRRQVSILDGENFAIFKGDRGNKGKMKI